MEESTVLTSRVRLARNIKGMPFPNHMTAAELNDLIRSVAGAINGNGDFLLLVMSELPERERRMLVERHLISPDLANSRGAALINKDETLSILIGEEDHLRIQCLLPGLQLKEADALSQAVDRAIGERLPYAFDEELGYLTACPTNLGTGMRASVMVHIPALSLSGQSDALFRAIAKLGYAVRGLYGEGSGTLGHIYQISNQVTLGVLEEDIIANLAVVTQQAIDREAEVRQSLYENNPLELSDIVFRSLGILRYARQLSGEEGMEHLSNLKLGVALNLLPELTDEKLNRLFTNIQSATLQQQAGRELSERNRDAARATLLRTALT